MGLSAYAVALVLRGIRGVAPALSVSTSTVKAAHLRNLYPKLSAHRRAEAVERASWAYSLPSGPGADSGSAGALRFPRVASDSPASFRTRAQSAVGNHPNRGLDAHPYGVQAHNGSSPESEELNHEGRGYRTSAGCWPVS